MAKGTPTAVVKVRQERIAELKAVNSPMRLRPLTPGPRTTNKCLTLLVGVLGYAVEHGFASRNAAAANMDKLPKAEGEGGIIEQNVLTPPELRRLIDASADPWGLPIMFAGSGAAARPKGRGYSGAISIGIAGRPKYVGNGVGARFMNLRRSRLAGPSSAG
jgi:hypothetical protein